MKTAIINCADTGPFESLQLMLNTAGYHCYIPDDYLSRQLSQLGGLVLTNEQLVSGMGYSPIHRPAYIRSMDKADLYVDIKAHQTYPKLVERWPHLKGRVLWYRINGGQPEHVIRRDDKGRVVEDCGDEVNPPCPVLTPNQWYADHESNWSPDLKPWLTKAYTMWPPFVRMGEYPPRPHWADSSRYDRPVCLVHNVNGWGYQSLVEPVRELGVRVFGRGSPDGLVPHADVPRYLQHALAYVCLKSNDAPGYHLYEAIAAGCPVIAPRRLVWRCRMQELFEPMVTYLPFDRETHDPLTDGDVKACTEQINAWLWELKNPEFNRKIADTARQRLKQLLWKPERDGPGFIEFMRRNFP